MVLYPVRSAAAQGTDLQVLGLELVFFRGGREVERTVLNGPLSPNGSHALCNDVPVDAVEIRFGKLTGRVRGRPVAGLIEVVTIARLVED